MESTQHKSELITTRVEHGILIVKIELNSLMHEMVISQVESSIMEVLPRAKTSILIDCSELHLHVSSQFLSSLMCVYRNANARGTKLAVCNLSSTLRAGYEVTALTTLIPAYDSLELATEELKQLQVRDTARPETRRESPLLTAAEPIRLSRTAIALIAFAFLFFCSAAFMLGTLMTAAPPPEDNTTAALVPFETSVTGTLSHAGHAANAWVIAWPVGYEPQSPVTVAELQELSRSTSDWSRLLSVTETSTDGRFELSVRGFGSRSALNVLVLDKHRAGVNHVAAGAAKVLAGVMAEPTSLLATHRHLLVSDVEIQPHAVTDYRWKY